MLLSVRNPITNSYPLEASGWGSDQSFFVEKCELEWNEETGKYVTLTRSLCPRSMIFVRLVQPTSPDRSLPVPYHTQAIGPTAEGQQQFRLEQVRPSGGSATRYEEWITYSAVGWGM
jgi:hypothetical protein